MPRSSNSFLRCLSLSFVLLGMLFGPVARAMAQQGIGSITGKIVDEQGGGIPDATITIINQASLTSTIAKSDGEGNYTSPPIASGTYNVQIEKATFRQEAQRDFALSDDQRAELNFTLKPGSVSETVEVQANAPALNTFNATLGSVIDNAVAESLPLNGSAAMSLAQLDPGVVSASGPVNEGFNDRGVNLSNIRIGAGLAGANANLLDGANNLQTTRGEILINATIAGIQETRLQYGVVSAQYGLMAGGIITMASKSGTNALHGEVYEYFRNTALNSVNHFALKGTRPVMQYNQYGAALGGPIVHDRAFFFGNYEAYGNKQTTPTAITVPTDLERTGDFSDDPYTPIYDANTLGKCTQANLPAGSCRYQYGYGQTIDSGTGTLVQGVNGNPSPNGMPINAVPKNMLDPAALAFQDKFIPHANLPGLYNNYITNWPLLSSQTSAIGRIDWQVKRNLSLFARYAYYENITNNEGSYGYLTPIASTRKDDLRNQDYTIGITQVASPTMLNDIRLAFGRSYFPFSAGSSGQNLPQQLGIPGVPPNTLPDISIQNYGITVSTQQGVRTSNVPEVNDTVTILHGVHSLHIGAGMRFYESLNNTNYYPSGLWSFSTATTAQTGASSTTTGNAYAAFLMGQASSVSATISAPSVSRIFSVNGYVQDDWRTTSNLTLNFGVRYDYQSIPWEKHNGFSTLRTDLIDPQNGLQGREIYAGVNGGARNFAGENYHDLAPRIGFALLLSQKHHTVLRGGYALYYAASSNTIYSNAVDGFGANTTTYVAPTSQGYVSLLSQGLLYPPLGLPGAKGGPGMLLGQSPTVQPQSAPTSASQQFVLALDHEFPGKTIISVFALMSHGTHFPMTGINLNQLDPKFFQQGTTFLQAQTNNPYQNYGISGTLGGKTIQELQALKPYPYFQNVYEYYPHIGNYMGRSGQVIIRRPVYTGLQLQLGYNYGRLVSDPLISAITAAPTVTASLQNNYAPHSEYSIDPSDVTNRFSGNLSYTLPFGTGQRFLAHASDRVNHYVSGWAITGTLVAESGRPLAITGNNNAGASRPNFVPGVNIHVAHPSASQWFNPLAFTIAPNYTFGNVPRTLSNLRGPGDASLNINLVKQTKIKKITSEFQVSAYNVLNKTNLGMPNTGYVALNCTVPGAPTQTGVPVCNTTQIAQLASAFGSITTATQARIMQITARIRF